MEETFLININCSKILSCNEATQYTMFIDSTKMSIVYELIEWIRWIFSVDYCVYLMHENSVIHELEDIQLLSKLKSFEIIPCGGIPCVHKKLYRTLLDKFNLFDSWNNTKVPKYFLEKVRHMNQKPAVEHDEAYGHVELMPGIKNQQSCMNYNAEKATSCKNTLNSNIKTYSNEKICNSENLTVINTPILTDNFESAAKSSGIFTPEKNLCFNEKPKPKENCLIQFDNNLNFSNDSKKFGENSLLGAKTIGNLSLTNSNPSSSTKEKLKVEESTENHFKIRPSKKCFKPFSLGEVLSNLRENLEEPKDSTYNNNTESQNSSPVEGGSFSKNLLVIDEKGCGDKKRQRTRKRKKSKKQILDKEEFVFPVSLNQNNNLSSDTVRLNYEAKPTHIRFDAQNDDCVMDTDCVEDKDNKGEFEINDRKDKDLLEFFKTGHKQITSSPNNSDQHHQGMSNQLVCSSPANNSLNNIDISCNTDNQITGEGKLIDIQDEVYEKGCQSFGISKNSESNNYFNELLSMKEKFKTGVVIKRFY